MTEIINQVIIIIHNELLFIEYTQRIWYIKYVSIDIDVNNILRLHLCHLKPILKHYSNASLFFTHI